MKLVTSLNELDLTGAAVCIGNFDGVHLGHQMLLSEMRETAQRMDAPSIVVTFFPPAKVVFGKGSYLTSREEKVYLLEKFQPDAVVMTAFSLQYAQTPKEVFLDELRRLAPSTIIVGEDFRFGHKRSGGLDDLQHVTERLQVFGLKKLGDDPIKSSRIRELLQAGEVEEARALLGYSYLAMGEVIKGENAGAASVFLRQILNYRRRKRYLLVSLLFASKHSKGTFGGMANVGPRPSFPEEPPSLEVYLFDFKGDLYGQTLTVSFEHFLRSQKKFSGLEEVKAQLAKDEEEAKARLQN